MKALKEQWLKHVAGMGLKSYEDFHIDDFLSQMRAFESQLRSHAQDVGLILWVKVCCDVDGKRRCEWVDVANGPMPGGAYEARGLSPKDVYDAIDVATNDFPKRIAEMDKHLGK